MTDWPDWLKIPADMRAKMSVEQLKLFRKFLRTIHKLEKKKQKKEPASSLDGDDNEV